MRSFFSYDGRFAAIMDRIAGLFWLNVLILVTSLPVITAGASLTAGYYVTLKMARNEESYLTKSFFKSFKQNFRQSTVIWLVILFFGAIFFLDYKMLNITAADGTKVIPFANIIFVVICAVVIVFAMTGIYVYPVLAKFDNTTINTIKNAFLMSVLNFPKTLMLMGINLIFPALFVFSVMTNRMLWIIPVVICFGISTDIYLCSRVFVGIFDKYIPDEADKSVTDAAEKEKTE